VAIVAALAPLLVVKLLPATPIGESIGFLGLSYVTFRALDVIIGIQDRLILSLPPVPYVTYLLFFPAASSGPIDRYKRFVADLQRHRTRREYLQDLDAAVQHVFRGLLYKFILASLLQQYWLEPMSRGMNAGRIVSYMYAYTFYLFFDFAGYSAFAVGVSYLFGIHTPENFNHPFLATNIVDFWNRWHISLSTWFRDHLYMRFLMAASRGRWFTSRLATSCAGFYLSFVLMGIWHGIAPRYVVYGLYHATLMAGYTMLARRPKPGLATGGQLNVTGMVITFHLVAFGLLIFSGRLSDPSASP